jgi:transcriptional regulator with XRE-family HTH domain
MLTMKEYRQRAGLTIDALAERAGVTHDLVVKFEAATFTTASPNIVEELAFACDVKPSEIVADYNSQRAGARDLIVNLIDPNDPPPWLEIMAMLPLSTKHPYASLREYIFERYGLPTSAYYYCKAMGIPHSSLAKYESGREANMPVRLREALSTLSVPTMLIRMTAELGVTYARTR